MSQRARYYQQTGILERVVVDEATGAEQVTVLGQGWAGNGAGKNNPDMQDVHDVGPLPRGLYAIGEPETASTGPYSLRLTPDPANEMFGRSGFLIHGPAVDPAKYGEESKGCIVVIRGVRNDVHNLGLETLEVVA